MKTFTISGESPASFVARVGEAIKVKGLADIASVRLEDEEIVVSFSWMGRSTLRYTLTPCDEGHRAELASQRVSPLHAAFQRGFEEKFEQIIDDVNTTDVEI
jgi:hypothetical protein